MFGGGGLEPFRLTDQQRNMSPELPAPSVGAKLKSLMLLWQIALNELGAWCDTATIRDQKTALDRFEHEGDSFFGITLPDFCKDFQKSLDRGAVADDVFLGFAKARGLPHFLGGFLQLVFDRDSGVLLDEPNIDAIFAVRQVTLMFSKVSLPVSERRVRRAMEDFVECEKEVRKADAERTQSDTLAFSRICSLLYASCFSRVDLRVYNRELRPAHGPGATADRLSGNRKYDQQEWTERLEAILPAGEMLLPNWRYWDRLQRVDFLEPGAERPVRVITVPKTLKAPRIIAIEPTAMQYAQQGLQSVIREEIAKDDLLSHFLGFDDQTPNQRLARIGSVNQNLATLDLSEASDRVSNQLVRTMLSNHPHVAEAVDACRTRRADVQGHGVLRLSKFASMGSALCFPMEAMVFLAVIFLGIQDELKTPLTRSAIRRYVGRVRVYGDDIVVPVRYVSAVVSRLETFGFRVNAGKSFWTGKFRESCGRDYYNGQDVTPVKVRRVLPTQPQHVEEVMSMVSTRNQFYQLGLWGTCQWMDAYLRDVLTHYPVVLPTSPVLGRESVLGYDTERLHPTLHSPLVKGYVMDARLPVSRLDDVGALLKYFLTSADSSSGSESVDLFRKDRFDAMSYLDIDVKDVEHLERAGRAQSVRLKLRWASAI